MPAASNDRSGDGFSFILKLADRRTLCWRGVFRRSFKERVLIIGAGEVGHTLAAKIAAHPEYRIDLIGFLDDGEPRRNGHGAMKDGFVGFSTARIAGTTGGRTRRQIVDDTALHLRNAARRGAKRAAKSPGV